MAVASFRVSLVAASLCAAAGATYAQSFPSRPLEFIVHTSPGGGTDVFSRAVADTITREKLVSQPVNISNRTGGSGGVAFNYVKSKRGDPHVILTIATGTLLTAAAIPDLQLGLDNYTPLAFFAMDPQAITVNASTRYMNVKELIEAAKREPNSIAASVASAGGTGRMLLYMLERETGAKMKFVAFKSGSDAALSVVGNHIPVTTENMSEMFTHVEAKKLRVLAVTGEKRLSILPDVPTLKEMGYPITVGTGRGFAMPAGVPKEAAAHMEGVLKRAYESAHYREFATRNMYEEMYMNGADLGQYLARRRAETAEFLSHINQQK